MSISAIEFFNNSNIKNDVIRAYILKEMADYSSKNYIR
ncbi:hypothetical protein LEP1GSC036_3162 [Leptospira weilii str. 2006001853]|uniref:Uncharacterized protein n=4 Tax=Leptospira weilii TaxID=28184 RepID=A0A828YY11_9LEPT|nr:hypothetical protein LEP1GSC036_3162 [Leptospira weilii str. 2006001853]EMJ60878.1 hypothetical protein LEP1GSC051_2682 [Leptospira sp. P2653]EMM72426.1 hypothetical protein LEP1GSC038_3343 [Leptospira weilii str. 2006001855]EMN43563.1 hypothetical protein LEP1GSC086_0603 [Leptospira weilii str. LNT 1234]EMN90962.1 hypothetical protein LEP1GSC108_4336 [Leptospira weilii str. UI 13098]EMY15898.1 hypothetical protein LEP1GSC043_2179 [Leptospira weilii str. Ecochallenge]